MVRRSCGDAGLYVTWPTSYEALVGRAELKAGTSWTETGVLFRALIYRFAG